MASNELASGFKGLTEDGGLGARPNISKERIGINGVSKGAPATIQRFKSNAIGTMISTLQRGSGLEQCLHTFLDGAEEIVSCEIDDTGGTAADAGTATADGGNTGTGTAATGGTPYRDAEFILEVVASGGVGDAVVKISSNNGADYGANIKVLETAAGPPLVGRIYLEEHGVGYYIELTDNAIPADSFVAGDIWTWSSAEAIPTSAKMLDAVEKLMKYEDEGGRPIGLLGNNIIYVAQELAAADWEEIHQLTKDYWEDYSAPYIVYVNVIFPTATAGVYDITTWIAGLESDSDTYRLVTIGDNDFPSGRVVPNAVFMRLPDEEGTERWRPAGGVAAGKTAMSPVHVSIGYTRDNRIASGKAIGPYNSDDDRVGDWRDVNNYNERLGDAFYLTARYKAGKGAFFIDDPIVGSQNTSDYQWIRRIRIHDQAVHRVQDANFDYINSPGTLDADMNEYQDALEEPLKTMRDIEKSLVIFRLTLVPDPDIALNGEVHATLEMVDTPTKKKLITTFILRKSL